MDRIDAMNRWDQKAPAAKWQNPQTVIDDADV